MSTMTVVGNRITVGLETHNRLSVVAACVGAAVAWGHAFTVMQGGLFALAIAKVTDCVDEIFMENAIFNSQPKCYIASRFLLASSIVSLGAFGLSSAGIVTLPISVVSVSLITISTQVTQIFLRNVFEDNLRRQFNFWDFLS